jgi:plastocyanin
MFNYFRGMAAVVFVVAVGAAALRSTTPGRRDVAVKLFQFEPEEITVRAGTRIRFRNLDEVEHSVRFGIPEQPTLDLVSASLIHDSATTVVLEKPGRYAFYCARHPFMRGEITVTE